MFLGKSSYQNIMVAKYLHAHITLVLVVKHGKVRKFLFIYSYGSFHKVFEIVLHGKIYPLVKNHITPFQHGFIEQKSTVSNLTVLTQGDFTSA